MQIEDIEVEKDCDDAPYNVIDEVAPAIEQECTAPHRKRIRRKVASTVKKANNAKRTSTKPKKKEKQLTRAEKLEMFLGYFDIPKYWIRVIPSFLVRENETDVRKCSSQKSYSMYENELKEMFFMGLEYSNLKMSEGKMQENLKKSHPECFSIPGETEIKQFINKMSEQQKIIATNKDK